MITFQFKYDGTYDDALPQTWVDAMQARGFDPRGHFVWAYPSGSIFGCPMPKTAEGVLMLARTGVGV